MCGPETGEPIKKEEKKNGQSSGEPTPKKETEKVSELHDPGDYYVSGD